MDALFDIDRQPAKLALEDGSVFAGYSFGSVGETEGEVCFNTSMTGYQEILTDPSYRGQIVAMTYPQIGNYGVNRVDVESFRPHVAGFVVRAPSRIASNYRAEMGLEGYLVKYGIVGLCGLDTRALVRHIRAHGALKGFVSSLDLDDGRLVARARASAGLVGRDLVRDLVAAEIREWEEGLSEAAVATPLAPLAPSSPHVAALDFGMKWNIARHLRHLGCRVTILPGTATADEVMALHPDGVFLSNGPGDPEPLTYAVVTIRALWDSLPLFGICLGHQLLALAAGARTFKLKFGHRGTNQPVLNCLTGKIEITSQNHGFSVDESSLPDELEVTHRNLNDGTIAGLRHRQRPAFSVQFHPEASAGPHDSQYLLAQFRDLMLRVASGE